MRVLVIGGSRFVGLLLVWRLLAGGHKVTIFNRGTLPDPFGDRVDRLVGDRTTPDFAHLLAGRSFDAAVDFAAYNGPEVDEVVRVLSGSVGHYVFISTGQVYLVRKGPRVPFKEVDYDGPLVPRPESEIDIPSWEYGIGKRACEDALIRAWDDSRFPGTRIRIPIVNGERDYQRKLEGYLWRLVDGGPVLVPDGGQRPVRHAYGGEVARLLAEILGNESTFGEAFNICQEEAPHLADFLHDLASMLGSKAEMVPIPSADIEAAGLDVQSVSPFSSRWMSMLDPSVARRALGFEHEPLKSYLGKIIASFLAHTPSSPPEAYAQRADEIALAARAKT